MIKVNGREKSGSGTILRYAVSLSTLLGEDLFIHSIRARRKKPGLRPQHLKGVLALSEMCGGTVNNAQVGSHQILYRPGKQIRGGYYEWDIGTAGSTTMLATTVLPAACFATTPVRFRIKGGLFQDYAPSAYHMQWVLFPLLREMGVQAELKIIRPGYVPRGGGVIEVRVEPVAGRIRSLNFLYPGNIREIKGIAISSHLEKRKVSERMAKKCKALLRVDGYGAQIKEIYDTTSIQEGAALALFSRSDTGCIIGSDRAGKPGRSSEEIGRYVAKNWLQDIQTGATVDRYLADQLIIYAALAERTTEYLIPRVTEHVDTNLWLVNRILGAKTTLKNNRLKIEGIGFK
jgi:RNA 3'-terminal phosphate cyclase (ATP)